MAATLEALRLKADRRTTASEDSLEAYTARLLDALLPSVVSAQVPAALSKTLTPNNALGRE